MPRENGRIRIYSEGPLELPLVRAYLADFEYAYNGYLAFETAIDAAQRVSQHIPYPLSVDSLDPIWIPLRFRRRSVLARSWPPTPDDLASAVPRADRLLVKSVQLSSPGFWEFIGKLNPLEVFRQYLNDRHERRKDHEYRESAEERRLALENLERENDVLRERIAIARDLGATDRDLAPLLNELVYRPLQALDQHQDRNVIEYVDVEKYEDPKH